MNYFVTAIDTDSGKTVASAILCEALQADYWKPVQAGLPLDSDAVKSLVTNDKTIIYPERYFLKTAVSPHAASVLEDIKIELDDFVAPTSGDLIIEGAGGCLVPLNDHSFVIDLAERFQCAVILVADLYLGSINHTLLTIQELKHRNLPVKGIIFNGEPNPQSERIILHHANIRSILHIEKEKSMTRELIRKYADKLMLTWNE
jgi:dethiobiotin synthetase